jgi:cytoskeletal protein CcmA (bactofilin family)
MDGILSGFPFSRKKEFATQIDIQKSEPDRSNSMRLTKNDPAIAFPGESEVPSFNTFNEPSESPSKVAEMPKSKTPVAVIGPKITFKGELTGEEDLVIMGTVEGSIDLKGNHLTIANQGVIKANVSARTITVEGKVEGDIVATERISVKSASNVKGNLKAERVTLEDGAKFRGSIDMDVEASSKSAYTSSYNKTTESGSTE